MKVSEAILGRRTIHKFRDDELPKGVLEEALEAAIWAPNHKLTNPWRFVLVGPKTRTKIVDIVVDLKALKRPLSSTDEARLRSKLETSPVMIAAVQCLDSNPRRLKEDYASMACAIQNLSLSLWAHGVGAKWSTTFAINDPRTMELLKVSPEGEEIVGFIYAGYPDVIPKTHRQPLSKVVREVP